MLNLLISGGPFMIILITASLSSMASKRMFVDTSGKPYEVGV